MSLFEAGETLQHDELHIVVALTVEKLSVRAGSGPNGGRGGRKGNQRPSRFVRDSGAVRLQQVEERPHESGFLRRIFSANFSGQFQDKEGKTVSVPGNLVQVLRQELDGQELSLRAQEKKSVATCAAVGLRLNELLHEFRGVRDKVGGHVAMDVQNGQGRVLPHVGMTVLQTGFDGGDEGLQKVGLAQLAEKTEHGASDVLVGVVEVVPEGIAHENHLTQELFGRSVVLGNHFPVKHQKLLEQVIICATAETNHAHQNAGEILS